MTDGLNTNQNQENQLLQAHVNYGFKLADCLPIELAWNRLAINATIDTPKIVNGKSKVVPETKVILNQIKGALRPGQFTAILGPSGSGKTTLLNFLSGRLISDNLSISGELFLNSKKIKHMDKYNDQIAYVMQDDILLATFTTREAFTFSANLRLNLSLKEKTQRIEQLIQELGLTKCADTYIGNNLIRGVSGGERKRASIGVELLTNPSLIFLDEPTTGLDSSTALQVVDLLKRLAVGGRTIVSTIHQPSSEIYSIFDRLMLLMRGNIVYQGPASSAVDYFAEIGYKCPAFSNPSDYFMKLMNEEGLMVEKIQKGEGESFTPEQIEKEFQQRIEVYINYYRGSENYKELDPKETVVIKESSDSYHCSWWIQFKLIFIRAFLNEMRNPLDVKLKLISSIVYGIMVLIVFSELGHYLAAIQNINGALFFLTTTSGFASTMGALTTFSIERSLFLRERLNRSYSVGAYFWAKSSAELPFQILCPAITVCITYFAIGLNQTATSNFFILAFWYGVSYGVIISILIPKIEVSTSVVPAIIIPFMILGGFFINQQDVTYPFYPFMYISVFKYAFQASVINEYNNRTVYCAPNAPPCDPIEMMSIDVDLWASLLIMFCLGLFVRGLSFFLLHRISTPKKTEFKEALGSQ